MVDCLHSDDSGFEVVLMCGSAFDSLLDDSPLGSGEISSSVLTDTAFHAAAPGEKGAIVTRESSGVAQEVEKGMLLLIASDTPGLQVKALQFQLKEYPLKNLQYDTIHW